MKRQILWSVTAFFAASLAATAASPKEEVIAAAKKLAEKNNYSWKTVVVVPESARFKPGPSEGKTEKDGFTDVVMTFGENMAEAVLKGNKAVVTNPEGEWKDVSELENAEGPGRFLGRIVRNLKPPAAEALELAAATADLKKEGDVYAGQMTDEGAKAQFRLATPKTAKGSVKFWVKDGVLTKYEFKVQAKVDFNGNEVDVDRTTTVEIKDVNTTKVIVPEGAKKKF